MSEEVRLDRRKFLGAAAGVAGAAALGTWSPWAESRPNGPNGPIVTSETLGIQHFSVRDATGRVDKAVMGYLGGPTFPENPADLGPLVPLPGGFEGTFEYLRSVGYRGFEFFQLTQAAQANSPANPTPAQIRAMLDRTGMRAMGTHQGGTTLLGTGGARRRTLDFAVQIGYRYIGTAGDPAGGAAGNSFNAWKDAANNFNAIGEELLKEGFVLFFHPEGTWWQFFTDPQHPELNNTHKIDFFAANTDPRYVFFEIDTYHMYQNRILNPLPGSAAGTGYWDAEAFMKRNWKRIMGFHIKDAVRRTRGSATSDYVQLVTRPGFPANINGGQDAVNSLEGDVGKGYTGNATGDPDPNVIGFRRMFTEIRSTRAKGFRFHIVESDSAPDTAANPQDPGRSLRLAKVSARNLLALK